VRARARRRGEAAKRTWNRAPEMNMTSLPMMGSL
jgi:hypothetical protein